MSASKPQKLKFDQSCTFEVVLAHCSLCLRADPVLRPQHIVFDNYFFLFSFLCKIDDLGVEITKSWLFNVGSGKSSKRNGDTRPSSSYQFQHESYVDHKAFRKHDHIFPMPDFRISKIQDSKFSDWGHFEPEIIDFVKKLIRKMAPSQNRVLGVWARAQHGTQNGACRNQSFYP